MEAHGGVIIPAKLIICGNEYRNVQVKVEQKTLKRRPRCGNIGTTCRYGQDVRRSPLCLFLARSTDLSRPPPARPSACPA
eukprot:4051274-Prymnesium_polylepis.1